MGLDGSIPEKAERKIDGWDIAYQESKLKEWPLEVLESKQLEFESEVERLKAEYRRGCLVDPEMAAIAGKEPLTRSELEQTREQIDIEAEKIQSRFLTAIGHKKSQQQEWKSESQREFRRALDSAENFVLSCALLVKELKGKF